jgi:hypothetical protein
MTKTRGSSLVPFGAVMLMLVGTFNLVDGIVALANPDYLRENLLFSNLSAWGWFFVVFGVLQVIVGFAVLRGSQVALWPGIALAGINAVAHLAYVRSNPAWSIAIMVLDVVVIYGFMAQGMALGIEPVPPPADEEAAARRMGVSDPSAV